MNVYPTFSKAPITEAILDIQVELPTEINLDKLSSFHGFVKSRFPEKQERRILIANLQISSDKSTEIQTPKIDGYLFRSSNDNKIVQCRFDGFSFNKLKPYENWELFQSEAIEHWELYCKIVNPIKVKRLALRYINKIEIPLPFSDFKEYVLTIPEIAPHIPQALLNFFMRLVIPNPVIESIAIITETMEKPINNVLPLIFDIDVSKNVNYEFQETKKWWSDFEKLRNFKNEIFFRSLTDKARELFK